MSRAWQLGNALWLQLGWWGCVLGAERGWLLPLVGVGLCVHLACCADSAAEFRALVRVALCGWLLDTGLGLAGVFRFPGALPPPWLLLLWPVFASSLRHSLAWAARPLWRGAVLGALGGPLAYLSGARLANVDLPLGELASGLLLAAIWALWLPLMLRLANARQANPHQT
ncbi:DUF2878 domain-containing protein [Pseudomonas sp. CAN2814]|uniref:DUF2878 domain-containing protein n=1 Tax=Pseudomonas sp. CAN1 TaxID=3046726 RepID=UPI002647556F|nr:DUF2878 domain-containing protein [Pseudomonas sp. CAN1]MDN6858975.1 DUF2878 domain-containing protein [Pseudomonas sp. CAN1]